MAEDTPATPRPILESFEVHDFRAIRHARIDLEPDVTILVGRNDVGKSTLLETISLYHHATRVSLRDTLAHLETIPKFTATWRFDAEVWTHTLSLDPRKPTERFTQGNRYWFWNLRTRTLETHAGTYEVKGLPQFTSLGLLNEKQWRLDSDVPEAVFLPLQVAKLFAAAGPYLFEPSALRKPTIEGSGPPRSTGQGWPAWLQAIQLRRNDELSSIEATLRSMFPFFRGVTLRLVPVDEPTANLFTGLPAPRIPRINLVLDGDEEATPRQHSLYVVDVEIANEAARHHKIPYTLASTGLLLALVHLVLAYADDNAQIILLEEPENGLNAKITLEMMRAFLAAIERRKHQLILTTHNPWWLDLLPHRSIRVVTRDSGGAHVERPDPIALDSLLKKTETYPSELVDAYGPEGLLLRKPPTDAG